MEREGGACGPRRCDEPSANDTRGGPWRRDGIHGPPTSTRHPCHGRIIPGQGSQDAGKAVLVLSHEHDLLGVLKIGQLLLRPHESAGATGYGTVTAAARARGTTRGQRAAHLQRIHLSPQLGLPVVQPSEFVDLLLVFPPHLRSSQGGRSGAAVSGQAVKTQRWCLNKSSRGTRCGASHPCHSPTSPSQSRRGGAARGHTWQRRSGEAAALQPKALHQTARPKRGHGAVMAPLSHRKVIEMRSAVRAAAMAAGKGRRRVMAQQSWLAPAGTGFPRRMASSSMDGVSQYRGRVQAIDEGWRIRVRGEPRTNE